MRIFDTGDGLYFVRIDYNGTGSSKLTDGRNVFFSKNISGNYNVWTAANVLTPYCCNEIFFILSTTLNTASLICCDCNVDNRRRHTIVFSLDPQVIQVILNLAVQSVPMEIERLNSQSSQLTQSF